MLPCHVEYADRVGLATRAAPRGKLQSYEKEGEREREIDSEEVESNASASLPTVTHAVC